MKRWRMRTMGISRGESNKLRSRNSNAKRRKKL